MWMILQALHGCRQLVSWDVWLSPLTSATLMKCWSNQLSFHSLKKRIADYHSFHTASDILEEGENNVKSSWPLWAGLHTCYIGNYKTKQWSDSEQIFKNCLCSDCSLQLESMKEESLVIVDQHATVNLYLSLVLTARHTLEAEWVGNKILSNSLNK